MARKKATKKAPAKKTGRNKTPPFENYPDWTTARFWSFIRSALRNASNKYPPKYQAKNEAKREYKGENKRQKYEYLCALCNQYFPAKDVEVDHIVPAGKLSSYEDLPGFVERLFCSKDGLRVVCKPCHKSVTNKERTKSDG